MAKLKFVSNHGGSKEMTKVLSTIARTPGWRLEKSAKGHVKVYTPEGRIVIVGFSKDPRSLKNSVAQLRRAGAAI